MGVALGRLTMARPLLESGRLVALTAHRLPDRFRHYLVYPPRSEHHPALVSFRSWVLGVARADANEPAPDRRPSPRKRSRSPAGRL
jgi:LysR family glycine cleavage system transcriptional activator